MGKREPARRGRLQLVSTLRKSKPVWGTGHSPECSNKIAVITGGNRKKMGGQQERKKDIATTHQ